MPDIVAEIEEVLFRLKSNEAESKTEKADGILSVNEAKRPKKDSPEQQEKKCHEEEKAPSEDLKEMVSSK